MSREERKRNGDLKDIEMFAVCVESDPEAIGDVAEQIKQRRKEMHWIRGQLRTNMTTFFA